MLALRRTALALLFLSLGVLAQDPNADGSSTDTGTSDTGATDTGADGTGMDNGSGDSGMGMSASPAASAPAATSGGTDPNAVGSAAPAASSAPAVAGSSAAPAAGSGAAAEEGSGNIAWNETYFIMPNRNSDGYWVNGIANVAAWIPVPDPADIILLRPADNTTFSPVKVATEIPGGVNAWNVTINDIPPNSGYALQLVIAGSNPQKKLGQSNWFTVKQAGTKQGSTATTPLVAPTYNPNPNGEANGAGGSAINGGTKWQSSGAALIPSFLGVGAASLLGMAALA